LSSGFAHFLFRELRKHRRFALLFVLLLGLGLSGFLLVEALRSSVSRSLEANARGILSADLSISLRRPFTTEEENKLKTLISPRPFSRTIELFSMLSKGSESELVLVKAVDEVYPLFGRLETSPPVELAHTLSNSDPFLIASPEVLEQLGSAAGDKLILGGAPFTVRASISDDPTQSFRTFALGGRAYVGLAQLIAAKLIQPGSTATWSYLVLTKSEEEARSLQKQIATAFPGPEWRISTAKEAGESSMRALSYLGDFLGLVSLVALLLSSLGAAYLYRSYLEKRKHEIAVFRALGLSLSFLQWQAAAQTAILALLSLIPALALAVLFLPVLERLINLWSSSPLELRLYPESLVPLFLLCGIGTPLLLLPELLVLKKFTPLALFREQDRESEQRPWLHHLPALFLFLCLAPMVARSFRNAGIFLGLLAVLVLVLFLVFKLFSRLLRFQLGNWTSRHAFLLLSRRQRSAAAVFLTLALGSLLVQLLPQLEASLRAELEAPTRLPSLFFFDIQQEQRAPLEEALASRGHKLTSLSPLVRARIISINGQAFVREAESTSFRTREEEQNSQFRNRAVNLSFRRALQDSETIIKGAPFSPEWNGTGVPELSIETRFAERLGVKIGDVLRFDVQGTEVEGRIVNERRVRWTSFQPNFFLVFQEGVLNDAPLSYLANLGSLPKNETKSLRAQLARSFPNISVLDVALTIEKALALLSKMRLALLLLAGLALASGLSVLASVLNLEARDRALSLLLYRALGASEADLRAILLKESVVLCGVAVAFGTFGSVAFTYGLCVFLFDGAFALAPLPLAGISFLLLFTGVLVSWLASRRLVKRPPIEALRGIG